MNNVTTRKFRTDLNWLRALAVVLVLLFHFNIFPFTGGFVGVDVFFVLSGFLMTQIILSGLRSNTFNFIDFFLRRLARILPALLTVCSITLCFGYFILLPDSYARLATEALQASSFVVNFEFAKSSDYFSVAQTHSWLLHCWSLAVEFQFYIIYPFVLFFAWSLGKGRGVIIALASISFASMLFSFFETERNQLNAFYLLPARAWEFLAGGAALLLPSPRKSYRSAVAIFGLAIILFASLAFSSNTLYPSLWSLIPVLGAFLIVYAQSDINFLKIKPIQYIGLLSYSLYLWHWPVIAIARYVNFFESSLDAVILLFITVALSWISFVLIEAPMRNAFRIGQLRRGLQVAGMGLLVGGSCIAIASMDGMPSRISNDIQDLVAGARHSDEYRDGSCFLRPDQDFTDFDQSCFGAGSNARRPTLAIWGDSNVAHLYPGIAAQSWASKFNIVQLTSSACGVTPQQNNVERPYCKNIQKHSYELIRKIRPEILILAVNGHGLKQVFEEGKNHSVTELGALIRTLRKEGVQNILVVGQAPKWRMPLSQIVFRDQLSISSGVKYRSRNQDADHLKAEDEIYQRISLSAGAKFASIYDAMCQSEGCLTLIQGEFEHKLVQFDTLHLTASGSEWVAEHVIAPALGQKSSNARIVLSLDTPIAFNAEGVGRRYLYRGWMPPEGWGAWTASQTEPGVIKLPVAFGRPPSAVQLDSGDSLGQLWANFGQRGFFYSCERFTRNGLYRNRCQSGNHGNVAPKRSRDI